VADAPSAYKVQQALAVWNSARARVAEEVSHDEADLATLLGSETEDVDDILARLLRAARNAEAMAAAVAQMEEDLATRKGRYKRRGQEFRATAFAILTALERSKFEMPDMTASIRNGQPSVQIVNEEEVPDIYIRLERKIDKATILSALKAGHEVRGCELSNSLPVLTLRTK
jgi:hypothetical protein